MDPEGRRRWQEEEDRREYTRIVPCRPWKKKTKMMKKKRKIPASTGAAMVCLCHCSICSAAALTSPPPKPKIDYWAWLWTTIIQWMQIKSQRERRQYPKDECFASYLKKKKKSLLTMNITTKFLTNLDGNGRTPQHFSIYLWWRKGRQPRWVPQCLHDTMTLI